MSSTLAVTAVIPTHNRRELVARTLRSVLAQKDVDLSVVVVDDGGADGTTAAIEELGHPNVRVVRHEAPKGVSAARNAGLAVTTTPWVAFVDDDDLWAPEKLAAQLQALDEHPAARWACVAAVHMDTACHARRCHVPPPSGDVAPLMSTGQPIPGGGSGVLVATEVARAVGGFDTAISILADWDFYLRCSLQAPVASVPRPLLGYYVHEDSMFHNVPGLVRETAYMKDKYAGGAHGPIEIDDAPCSASVVEIALKLRQRRLAARLAVDSVRSHGPGPLARKVGQTLSGKVVAPLARRLGRAPVVAEPEPWRAEAEAWLAAYADTPAASVTAGQ